MHLWLSKACRLRKKTVSKCFNMAAWQVVHATFLGHLYCSGQCIEMHSEYWKLEINCQSFGNKKKFRKRQKNHQSSNFPIYLCLFCHLLEIERQTKTALAETRTVTSNPFSRQLWIPNIYNVTEIAGEVTASAKIICILCPLKAIEIRDRSKRVSQGSGNQCPGELFPQDVLLLNSDSTLPHLPAAFVLIAFFVKYQWAPLKSAKGIVGWTHTCTWTHTSTPFRPVDTFKLWLFKLSVRAEHKPFVSEEHKAEMRARNNFYSVKKPNMARMIGMLKYTLKFHHSTQKELFIQRILWKATQSKLSA